MKVQKFGAIDLGSNAVRLLIASVIGDVETVYKKVSLTRVPLRLGADTFEIGEISEASYIRLENSINAFKLLMKAYEVENYKAFATSAMREASNGQEIADRIRLNTGINIEIIDGKKEASIISATEIKHLIDKDKNYLYVDVGGGSVEVSVFSKGNILNQRSFRLGTVRVLKSDEETIEKESLEMKNWIRINCKGLKNIDVIGSGGNINRVSKMIDRKPNKSISQVKLNALYLMMKGMNYRDRVIKLGLNTDRADVIIPATKLYLQAMKWAGAKNIFIPKIGLADGIVKNMWEGNIEPDKL